MLWEQVRSCWFQPSKKRNLWSVSSAVQILIYCNIIHLLNSHCHLTHVVGNALINCFYCIYTGHSYILYMFHYQHANFSQQIVKHTFVFSCRDLNDFSRSYIWRLNCNIQDVSNNMLNNTLRKVMWWARKSKSTLNLLYFSIDVVCIVGEECLYWA